MRIDKFLTEKYGSRTKAAAAVEDGFVLVNGKRVSPSYEIKDCDNLTFAQAEESFVSMGGYKLSKAIKEFGISVKDKIFADIGASTGGFCDCLFQNGAQKVYCIDVGENQLDKSLLQKNIVVIDNFNARNLTVSLFCESLDGAVCDVSFISLTHVLGAISKILGDGKILLALIKPQFEVGRADIGKGGIVKDKKARMRAVKSVCDCAALLNLSPQDICAAPVREGKNIEYMALFVKGMTDKTQSILKKAEKL